MSLTWRCSINLELDETWSTQSDQRHKRSDRYDGFLSEGNLIFSLYAEIESTTHCLLVFGSPLVVAEDWKHSMVSPVSLLLLLLSLLLQPGLLLLLLLQPGLLLLRLLLLQLSLLMLLLLLLLQLSLLLMVMLFSSDIVLVSARQKRSLSVKLSDEQVESTKQSSSHPAFSLSKSQS